MWPFSKKLEDVLYKKKIVYVHGVKFIIKKIDPSDFLDGSKVMLQLYDTYKVVDKKNHEAAEKDLSKVKAHYSDVFLSAVLFPKLSRKDNDGGLPVAHLFTEWELAHELYAKILQHTYGKKKFKRANSLGLNSQI
jgi:hypothetical protein